MRPTVDLIGYVQDADDVILEVCDLVVIGSIGVVLGALQLHVGEGGPPHGERLGRACVGGGGHLPALLLRPLYRAVYVVLAGPTALRIAPGCVEQPVVFVASYGAVTVWLPGCTTTVSEMSLR